MKWFGILALVSLSSLSHAKLMCSTTGSKLTLTWHPTRTDPYWSAELVLKGQTIQLGGHMRKEENADFPTENYELVDEVNQSATVEVVYLPVLDPTPHCTGRRICESDKSFSTEISAKLEYQGLTYTYSCHEAGF